MYRQSYLSLSRGRVEYLPRTCASPARPGLTRQPTPKPRRGPLELGVELGPLGPGADNAHLAPQHIDHLRGLVDPVTPQELSNSGLPGVLASGPDRARSGLRFHDHRPELQHIEGASVFAETGLGVEHVAPVAKPDRKRDCRPQDHPDGKQQDVSNSEYGEIEGTFVPVVGWGVTHVSALPRIRQELSARPRPPQCGTRPEWAGPSHALSFGSPRTPGTATRTCLPVASP